MRGNDQPGDLQCNFYIETNTQIRMHLGKWLYIKHSKKNKGETITISVFRKRPVISIPKYNI